MAPPRPYTDTPMSVSNRTYCNGIFFKRSFFSTNLTCCIKVEHCSTFAQQVAWNFKIPIFLIVLNRDHNCELLSYYLVLLRDYDKNQLINSKILGLFNLRVMTC